MVNMNITEKQIEDMLCKLSKGQLTLFAISCVDRVLHICEMLERHKGKLPKNRGYNSICSVLSFIKVDINFSDRDRIRSNIDKCNSILNYLDDLDDDWFPVICIIQSIIGILNFHLQEDISNIYACKENNLEVINQLKSDEYVNTINLKATDKELQEYLQTFFDEELIIEYDSIKLVENHPSQKDMEKFSKRNKFNVVIY